MKQPRNRCWSGLVALLLAAITPSLASAQSNQVVFPGGEWEYVRGGQLAAFGWSQDQLGRLHQFLRDSANSTGVVVVESGRVVYQFGDTQELSYLASVRKSVLAMLYGPFVDAGIIDLDKTISELGMDDVGGLLPIERRATVRDLITARSGVYHAASNSGDDLSNAPARGSQTPGTYMLYNNWDFNAAGAAFEIQTHIDIYGALQEILAIPLQFEDWDRSAQRKSGDLTVSRNPAYHMWLSTRDMARIGYLMLRKGNWNGNQVLSEAWVNQISGATTPVEEMNPIGRRNGYFGYGYMWWVFDGPRVTDLFQGAYTGQGAWGQWITVIPSLDIVIAHKTNAAYQRSAGRSTWERMIELLFAAKGIQGPAVFPWQ